MGLKDDAELRIQAQLGLLSQVTPDMRSVSVDVEPDRHLIRMRFIFHAEPSESVRDSASCAATEIITHYVDGWTFDEEYLVCPAPDRMEHLRLLVYERCEDEWVSPKARPDGRPLDA